MLCIKKHIIRQKSKKVSLHLSCWIFLFFLTYLLGSTTDGTSSNFFIEKTAETEKEETKSEKENAEEESEDIAYLGKYKKAKKLSNTDYYHQGFSHIQKQVQFQFAFSNLVSQQICSSYQKLYIAPACPLYIVYHRLVFYES